MMMATWAQVPQVARRYGCVISRPAWIWGAEMGVNECGVAIANEAIFSRSVLRGGAGLLGMDLVRLGLERGDSAESALDVICELLEEHVEEVDEVLEAVEVVDEPPKQGEVPDVGESAELLDIDELDFDFLDEETKDKSVGGDDPALGEFLHGLGD